MAAARKGHEDIVAKLLKAGAEVNFKKGGTTALQEVAKAGHEAVVLQLLKAQESENNIHNNPAVKSDRQSALWEAVKGGYEDEVLLMLKAGTEVNTGPWPSG
jgi:ankyrin repeat protein